MVCALRACGKVPDSAGCIHLSRPGEVHGLYFKVQDSHWYFMGLLV